MNGCKHFLVNEVDKLLTAIKSSRNPANLHNSLECLKIEFSFILTQTTFDADCSAGFRLRSTAGMTGRVDFAAFLSVNS